MSLKIENFTDKATKALADASELCQQYAHAQLLPIHLAVALFDPTPDLSKDQQNDSAHKSHAGSSVPLFRQLVDRAHGDPLRDIPYAIKEYITSVMSAMRGQGARGGYSAV